MIKWLPLLVSCLAWNSMPALGASQNPCCWTAPGIPLITTAGQVEASIGPISDPTAAQDFGIPQLSQLSQISDGYRIAKNLCNPCHVIGPHSDPRTILPIPGPRFEDLANRPDTSAEALKRFLATTDWDMRSRPVRMPKQRLSENSRSAVSAYIMSLRQQTIAAQPPGVDRF